MQRGSNIALYAAGQVGQAFYKQIQTTNYCNCVIWVDTNAELMKKRGLPVTPINDLLNTAFDTLIIAVKEQKTASSIKETLISKGIPEEKITWENPVKGSTA